MQDDPNPVEQAVEAFRIFTGVEPESACAYDALDRLLAARNKG